MRDFFQGEKVQHWCKALEGDGEFEIYINKSIQTTYLNPIIDYLLSEGKVDLSGSFKIHLSILIANCCSTNRFSMNYNGL